LSGVFGKTQSYAAAAAALAGLIFGMNLVKISEALTHYRAPAGRLRIIPGIKGSTIIDDTYNSSPTACHEALDVLRRLKAKRKIAVLGDMLELGRYTMAAHHEVGRLAAKVVDLLITVGLRAKFIAEGAIEAGMAKKSVVSFQSVREAGLFLQEKIRENDLILVKGSQGVRMERIVLEVMAEPQNAAELLVRQSPAWQKIKGLYD
jgi:UDP-N-acetylmuramyl pentapeptide synthase